MIVTDTQGPAWSYLDGTLSELGNYNTEANRWGPGYPYITQYDFYDGYFTVPTLFEGGL